MKKMLLLFALLLLFSCEKVKNPQEVAKNYMMQILKDNLKTSKTIHIESFEPDSFYMPIYENSTFNEKYSQLTLDYNTLKNNIRDYKILKGESYKRNSKTYFNGKFIEMYQDSVKAMIAELNELKRTFKPPYIGVRVPMYIEYSTSNKDSIIIAEVIMNDELDSIINARGIYPRLKDVVVREYGKINKEVVDKIINEMMNYQNNFSLELDTSFFINPAYLY